MKYFFPIVLVLGIALRILFIWVPPLWYDENFTVILMRLPWDRMIAATAGDVHPPLWYIVEWLAFHTHTWPVWTARLWSLSFSCLSLYAFWLIMREMIIPQPVRAVAFVLMAILPMQIWYAQEARMYALLEFLVLAALYNALLKRWWRFTIAAALMLYTQNYGWFYLASIWLVILVRYRRDIYRMTTHCILAALAFLPWISVMLKQAHTLGSRERMFWDSIGGILTTLVSLFYGPDLDDHWMVASCVMAFIAIILGLWYVARSIHPFKASVLVMAFGPMLMVSIIAVLWQPILLFRPLIGCTPFLYLVTAWPVDQLKRMQSTPRNIAIAYASLLVVPLLVASLVHYYRAIADIKSEGDVTSVHEVMGYITEHWQPGDVIYHTDDSSMIDFIPYLSLPQYRMPPCGETPNWGPSIGSLTAATRAAIGVKVMDLQDIPHTRAWVLAPRGPLQTACYLKQIEALTPGEPLLYVDQNKLIVSGVWLLDGRQ